MVLQVALRLDRFIHQMPHRPLSDLQLHWRHPLPLILYVLYSHTHMALVEAVEQTRPSVSCFFSTSTHSISHFVRDMIPQLKPDIYRCIAKHIVPDTTPHRDDARQQVQAYQQTLLNLMKSSKVSARLLDGSFHDIDDIAVIRHLRASAVHQVLRWQLMVHLQQPQ